MDIPKIVYHYTDGHGFLGILGSMKLGSIKLWCTHIGFLNDSAEWIYGGELVLRALKELEEDVYVPPRMREYANVTRIHITNNKYDNSEYHSEERLPQIYVASFSEDDDDLGQWRGYSSKNARYAIGFNVASLQAAADQAAAEGNGGKFERAEYDEAKLLPSIKAKFLVGFTEMEPKLWAGGTPAENALRPAMAGHSSEFIRVASEVRGLIGRVAKHPAFESEAEWRLSKHASSPISFRATSLFLVPYTEISLDPNLSLIASITIGPTTHRLRSEHSIGLFLHTIGLHSIPIKYSIIPYRD